MTVRRTIVRRPCPQRRESLAIRHGLSFLSIGAARAAVALCSLLAPLALGGEDKTAIERPPEVDPYTEGDRARMDAAGIVSFGPFLWAEDQTTVTIEELLGGIPILWAETAHFRLGSTLAEYEPGSDRAEKDLRKAELARLREKLPAVPKRVRKLDPWLRLHLYAQRLEELYADFQEHMGVTDADFAGLTLGGEMGDGPYLGQPEKFTVLLFERASSWGRYAQRYLRVSGDMPRRHNFTRRGTLFYGTSRELYYGTYDHDLALYCAVTFGVAQNLLDGLCAFGHETPLWLSVGTGHWYSRRVDERWSSAPGDPGSVRLDPDECRWEPKVRALVEKDYFVDADELFGWRASSEMNAMDNRFAWSRVDFLMRREGGAGPYYMAFAKPFPLRRRPVPFERVRERQEQALSAIDLTLDGFDQAWVKWVKRRYKRR